MTALPDPNALLQMARALGLHPVVTHALDSEAIAAVRVYRTELDNRAVVTWEATGIVCHAGLSWAPCSLAEAAAVLEVAAREAADERAARAVAEAVRQDDENAVATARIEAVCDGVETCGCDESRAWQSHVAILARKVTHLANNEEWLESEVARFSARLCEEQGKALDLECDLRAAEEKIQTAKCNAQHWEREAARLAKELKAVQAENEQLHDALAKAYESSESD